MNQREDSVIDKLMKWLFWIVLIIYLLAGHLQIRYWIGGAFGWQFNEETESLDLQGFGQIVEGISIVVAFLLFYIVYYLWNKVSKSRNWEPLFVNTKNTFKKIGYSISPKNIYEQLKINKSVVWILFVIILLSIAVIAAFSFLSKFPLFNYIIYGIFALLMIFLFVLGSIGEK